MISGGQVGSGFALRQALGAAVGGIVATILARTDYRKWQRAAWPVLALGAVLAVIPLAALAHRMRPTINGARRWVNLGFVTGQPAELTNFAVVVWTAMLAAKKGERIRTFQYGLLPFIVVIAPLVALIFLEPNLSMALLVALLAGVVLFTAGARIGHFLAIGVVATPLLFGAVASAQYRLARIVTFLNPGSAPSEATWQVHQSLVGIGAGRFFGVGLGQGQQKLGYLPYAYSDFIFSTIGEEFGFLGVLGVVLCFATFVWIGFRIARSAPDSFGQLLAVGLTSLIGVTAALHIGVSLAVLPVPDPLAAVRADLPAHVVAQLALAGPRLAHHPRRSPRACRGTTHGRRRHGGVRVGAGGVVRSTRGDSDSAPGAGRAPRPR